jgi:phospholipid-binding lipoprotein MlaA
LIACATPKNHYDPLEPMNRAIFKFNDTVDQHAVKPIAQAYSNHIPGPVKGGVRNFTGNIGDVTSSVSNVMQGDFKNAASDLGRVLVNTVFGMFGLVDWASGLGLKKNKKDIGQALGAWGIGSGPYLVWPLLGPSTLRDTSDLVVNWTVGVPTHFKTTTGRTSYAVANSISLRASLLPYDAMLKTDAIFDTYSYIRDSYLQKRYNDIYNGMPPTPLILGEVDDEQEMTQNTPPATTENSTDPIALRTK